MGKYDRLIERSNRKLDQVEAGDITFAEFGDTCIDLVSDLVSALEETQEIKEEN